jgi:hypothetical protein
MPGVTRIGDLEIQQDLNYQRREWRIQRLGWVVMRLVILAALLGLLGNGPLSKASVTATDGSLRLDYHRCWHYRNPMTLEIHAPGGATDQAALLDSNNSMTNSFLLIVTMVEIDIGLSLWKQRSPTAEKLIDGVPLLILADGIPIKQRIDKERVDEGDILAAARCFQGLERLDQIKYAVLERNGEISIVPKAEAKQSG